jgi:hypothetical protein
MDQLADHYLELFERVSTASAEATGWRPARAPRRGTSGRP